MAGSDVKQLLLQVDASVELLRRNLDKGERQVAAFEQTVERRMDKVDRSFLKAGTGLSGIGKGVDGLRTKVSALGGSLIGIAASFGVAFSVDAIVRAAAAGLDYASSLQEVADQLGVTTGDLQFYRYVATQTGISQDEMDAGLQKLTKTLGQAAAGGKNQGQSFKDLGVNIRDANGDLRTAGDILPDIAEGLSKLESPVLLNAKGTELFGKAAFKLIPALQGGAAGINELAGAYKRLGIELTPQQIANADAAADKLADVKKVLEARIAGVVADNADQILRLVEALAKLADKAIKAADAYAKWVRIGNAPNKAGDVAFEAPGGLFTVRTGVSQGVKAGPAPTSATPRVRAPASAFIGTSAFNPAPESLRRQNKFFGADAEFTAAAVAPRVTKALLSGGEKSARAIDAYAVEIEQATAALALAEAEAKDDRNAMAEAQRMRIEADRKDANFRVEQSDKITRSQKAEQIAINDRMAAAQIELVNANERKRISDETRDTNEKLLRMDLDALDDHQRTLESGADLAVTRRERLEIERRILAAQQEIERKVLEEAIARGEILDVAQARRNLEARQVNERGSLDRGNLSPGQQYLDDLKTEAGDINDAFERIAVGGARDLEESLSRGAAKALGLKGAVGSIIGEFARLAVQKAFLMLFSSGGTAGGGSIFSSIGSALGSIFGGKREGGGPVDRGKAYLVGERGPELFSPGISGAILSNSSLRSGGAAAFHFDLRGAVVTKDILAQMNAIGQRSAVEGAQIGRQLARQDLAKLQRPRI
ncbi:phage tail tape measure protein [Sphingobium boeckii]|uniref:Phage tail tape measure protein domain-containing protein n=1 Tax=Sphingobium boeckii TaxID=1082345 RepID=A0A7W9ECV2_9SPHN|nr:phage tail tape measure protein [Sphingobium boeckii]MBB5684289.1 hypothetical protein [Sphingobium boeckii]